LIEERLSEIFTALKPGGLLSITEVIADPHFQRRSTVRELASAVDFTEKNCAGYQLAYTLNLGKPATVRYAAGQNSKGPR
jgi:predicted methyltransferase